MSRPARSNALAGETSPYLLQHADNPVEWYPWCAEALARAREEDRPILLSIGYSACHWCHVMAHESFEDEATARLMNELYVNIKVDREERPDLDKIYQTAHQLLTRRAGGWPLTVVLTPDDLAPFFAGTYFPKDSRHGMPAFAQVLARIEEIYRERRDEVRAQNASLVEALRSLEPAPSESAAVTPAPIVQARELLLRIHDPEHGGFGEAPKFPHPTNVERLLRDHAASAAGGTPDSAALDAAIGALRAMALGGIYDQLGGGFCRYSVDAQWMIPHFEKMLYDNGPLLSLCAAGWQLTGDETLRRVATETAAWVVREMQSPEGGYYSSLDADSEGVEGKFYVWTPDEVRPIVGDSAYPLFAARFGLDRPANFEGAHWHLHVFAGYDELAERFERPAAEIEAAVDAARGALEAVRAKRVWPARDDKILTAWNGLMIKGMAIGGRVLDDPGMTASAERALDFVRANLWRDGRLLATCKDGRAHLAAYLDDHAMLADAALALLECRWRRADLDLARDLADLLLERFEDRDGGGFYFTADDHETLLHRPKPMMDDALPAGNAIAANVLARLGHLLGETRYLEASERAIHAAWASIEQYPHAHTALLVAVEETLTPPQTILLRGRGETLERWRRRAALHFAPRRVTLAIPSDADDLPGLLAERAPRGEIVAYVCEGNVCGAPIETFEAFEAALASAEVRRP